jgi:hypothetical protein
MTPRQRLQAVLEHKVPDRLCVDFGAGGQTGMGVCAVHRLRQALLGDKDWRVKVSELTRCWAKSMNSFAKPLALMW